MTDVQRDHTQKQPTSTRRREKVPVKDRHEHGPVKRRRHPVVVEGKPTNEA
jgi:hypothetical protein